VRVWHPGQSWIWEPGIGVFDPGVNAFSILTHILPGPLMVEAAELRCPANKAAPIAADLTLVNPDGLRVEAAFDFDQRDGPPTWTIDVETDAGALNFTKGAAQLAVDGRAVDVADAPEYPRLYARFAQLIARRETDADLAPFELVADAFLMGRRIEAPPFDDF
jgi:D-galactose 1-dehydrogenase